MPSHFLCPSHRQWLVQNASAANHYLADTQDTAQFYREQGQWQQALPYLGCAYEIAEIILTTQAINNAAAVISFTSSAILLADTFHKAELSPQGSVIFEQARQRLQLELTVSGQHQTLQSCLKDCIRALSAGAEYYLPASANHHYAAAIH